jgi:hypothetical protein
MHTDFDDGASPEPDSSSLAAGPGAAPPGAEQTLWQGTPGAGVVTLFKDGSPGVQTPVSIATKLAVAFTPTPVPVGPVFTPSPSPLAFGSVVVGQTKTAILSVTNTGDQSLTVDSEPIQGTNAAEFNRAAGTNVNPVTVAPGTAASYPFAFYPAGVGSKIASASFVTNVGTRLIPLTGTGTLPPPPPVTTTKDVRDFGAKGDGMTDDTAACQRALDAASAGGTVYFPAGVYHLAGPYLYLTKSGISFLGDGPASVLKYESVGLQIGPSGHPVGTRVSRLTFLGKPGLYQLDGNGATAIMGEMANLNSLPAGDALLVEDCDFKGCGWGYRSGGGSTVLGDGSRWAVKVRNCRFNGWGVCPFFLLSGEQVESCTLTQDDPGSRSSHGFYIHAGSRDVHVSDCQITNCRKWGIQVWCQYPNTVIDGVTLSRIAMRGCSGGLIIARSEVLGMAVRNVAVTGCTFNQTLSEAIHVNTGVNLSLTGNAIDTAGIGLYLDGPKGELTDMLFQSNSIQRCSTGVLVAPAVPPTGAFTRVQLLGNTITDCPTPVNLAGVSGIFVG